MDRFDDDLPGLLSELADAAPPIEATLMPKIRARAASQRRRQRGMGLIAASITLVAAIGGTAVVHAATSGGTVRPGSSAAPVESPEPASSLLGWPARGQPGFPDILVARAAAAWAEPTKTSKISAVRLLYGSETSTGSVIVVAEGMSAAGQARLAVLVSDVQLGTRSWETVQFRVAMDVTAPKAQPQVLLVMVGGLVDQQRPANASSRHNAGVVIALASPTAQSTRVVMTLQADATSSGVVRKVLDPAVGYVTTFFNEPVGPTNREIVAGRQVDNSFMLQLLPDGGNATKAGQACRRLAPDDSRFEKPASGGPLAAILVPVSPATTASTAVPASPATTASPPVPVDPSLVGSASSRSIPSRVPQSSR